MLSSDAQPDRLRQPPPPRKRTVQVLSGIAIGLAAWAVLLLLEGTGWLDVLLVEVIR